MSDRRVACKLDQKSKPYPYNAEQLAWLHDLETTKAGQVTDRLRSARRYCCLGRACVSLKIRAKIDAWGAISYCGEDTILPASAQVMLRLRDQTGEFEDNFVTIDKDGDEIEYTSLADMNDSGNFTFKEIAAYIRANPWNVFKAPEKNT